MDDRENVKLYWERSESAIRETAYKYEKYCYTISYNILDSHDDAEESVNDTWFNAWKSIPPHAPAVLATFLGKITRRVSIDKWRKKTADKRGGGEMALALEELDECIGDGTNIEKEVEKQALSKFIKRFVKSLPDTEQRVFVCRYWYMDSIEAIAEQFGFSESKVKSMLHRTRGKLRARLVKEGYSEID